MAAPNDKWADVWEAVKVVAVVGLVVGAFIGVGMVLARRREESVGLLPDDGFAPAPLGGGNGLGLALPSYGFAKAPPSKRPRSVNVGFRNFIVADRAVRIVSTVVNDAGRKIRITTDQPIRVMDSASVDALHNMGTFVTPEAPVELGPIGSDQQFFAVRAGPTAANVSVMTQFVRGE